MWDSMSDAQVAVRRILDEISLEVARAKQQWGEEFDQKNTLNDWVTYTNIYTSKAAEMGRTAEEQEKYLRKAAGLLINALIMLKSTGFAPRHYEGQTRPVSLPETGSLSGTNSGSLIEF